MMMSSVDLSIPVAELHTPCPTLFDLVCDLRPKPMPPVLNGFITYVDARFMQKVFYIPQ